MRFRIVRHGVVDSTSERAFAAIAAGEARHGDVHLAEAQTAGRGRLGRSWHSPAGEGLYLSLVLLPPPPPWSPAGLTMAAGLAALDAAIELGARGARLKWPNDVVVEGAKLAGVLAETRGFAPGRPHYVVGLGLNVRQRTFPADLAGGLAAGLAGGRGATSLALLGLDVAIAAAQERALLRLSARIDELGSTPERTARDFLRATGLEGAEVVASVGAEKREGVLAGLSIQEGLLLREPGGSSARLPLELVRELRARRGAREPL